MHEGDTVQQTAAVSSPGVSVWRDVDLRHPSAPERRLLAALATPVADPALRSQVATVLLDGICRCGCSSIRLRTDAQAVPAHLSTPGPDDHVAVASSGRTPDGHDVAVVLHLRHGRVHELEVFDTAGGEGVAVPLDDLTELTTPTVS